MKILNQRNRYSLLIVIGLKRMIIWISCHNLKKLLLPRKRDECTAYNKIIYITANLFDIEGYLTFAGLAISIVAMDNVSEKDDNKIDILQLQNPLSVGR